jgi:hypothetical protein
MWERNHGNNWYDGFDIDDLETPDSLVLACPKRPRWEVKKSSIGGWVNGDHRNMVNRFEPLLIVKSYVEEILYLTKLKEAVNM